MHLKSPEYVRKIATLVSLLLAAPAAFAASPSGWTTYGYDYANTRHVSFSQINPQNVKSLAPAWTFQTGIPGSFEASPIVVGKTMYLTSANDGVFALDAATGTLKWKYLPKLGFTSFCCGPVNRGVAVASGKVFVATLDGRLIALDARSGKPVWSAVVGDPKHGFSETLAPLAWGGMVYVGSAGGEYGIRGSVTAYAAATGKELWRWWTTSKNWEGKYRTAVHGISLHRDIAKEKADAAKYADAWKHGGGPVWTTPSLSARQGILYFGTGNPAPQLIGSHRPGDNLYTDSIVALNAHTGKMQWYYQETPHDVWDYDATSPTVLFKARDAKGQMVPAIGQAGKTGWFYVVNRKTGKLIRVSQPFAPNSTIYQKPGPNGSLIEPGALGGANWSPVSYDPATHLVFVASIVQPRFDKPLPYAEWKSGGARWAGSREQVLPTEPGSGTFTAIDVDTGRIAWQYKSPQPMIGGSLSAGGLVFVGENNGMLDAFAAKTGKLLWQHQCGAGVNAPPIAYQIAGKEYITVAAGGNLLLNTKPGDSVITFALPKH